MQQQKNQINMNNNVVFASKRKSQEIDSRSISKHISVSKYTKWLENVEMENRVTSRLVVMAKIIVKYVESSLILPWSFS